MFEIKWCEKNRIPCKYCSKTFANEPSYENHKPVYQKSRLKVKCPFCEKLCVTKSNLHSHLATKHPHDEVPSAFEFEKITNKQKKGTPTSVICKKSFTRNENLIGHYCLTIL